MLEITTEPGGFGTPVRRRNGDLVYLCGEARRQVKAVRKLLMKLARHFGRLPMIDLADFRGLDQINATNDELIECLSSVPDPYAPVDLDAAMVASTRDLKIADRILSRPRTSTIQQLLAVSDNAEDWHIFWRVRSPNGFTAQAKAADAEFQKLKTENRARLAQRKADGRQTN
jgi:hypothetical protein